jgi:hypothetical protein
MPKQHHWLFVTHFESPGTAGISDYWYRKISFEKAADHLTLMPA